MGWVTHPECEEKKEGLCPLVSLIPLAYMFQTYSTDQLN